MALTDLAIRSAKPKDKPYKLGDMLGLFLLVQPSGGKLWRFKYRLEGKERKLAIGTYPALSLGAVFSGQVGYQLDAHWQASVTVNNIGNRRYYQTVNWTGSNNYYGDPRNVMFAIKMRY